MELSKQEGYPYLLDWKKYIRPETIVILDSDQNSFQAASSNETKTIEVTHKASGRKKSFKTRTEFWGNKKKSIGGWLGDVNITRETKNQTPFTKEDFEVVDVQTPNNIAFCLNNLKSKINGIVSHLGLTEYKCILGGHSNFRLNLPAPEQYKSNREDAIRPLQLQEARDYLIKHHNAEVIEGMEGDDKIAQYGYEGYQHFLKHGWFNYIIATFDKDNLTQSCLMFNTYSDSGVFKHPVPILVDDGVGGLFLEKGKVKGHGFKLLCFQLAVGDPSDHVLPYQSFDLKFGETSAYKLLQPLKTKKECLEAVILQYLEWFPNGVNFTNWDGTEVSMKTGQWLDNIYKMVHMKLSENDKSNIATLIKELGIDFKDIQQRIAKNKESLE